MSNIADSMSNITPAKRTHMQNVVLTGRKKLKHISCAEKDCITRIRSQRLTFHSLPEDIVSRIMSGLTLKEAVRTSVVSSRWRQFWSLHPNLRFDISSVLGSKSKRKQNSDRYKRMLRVRRSVNRVNHVLRKHSGLGVNKLVVKFELRKEHADHIDGWVKFAVASKPRIVTFNFSPYLGSYETNYSFPCYLFNSENASYLQALRLDSVNLGPSPDFCGFANLKMLALDHVLALQDLQYFLSKCPVLEWLSIQWCYQKCNLHASALLCRSKYLCVKNCDVDKIEFVAPNLNTFEYRGSRILIKFHECSKLKTANIELIVHSTIEYVFIGLPNVVPHVETLRVEAFVNAKMLGFKYAPLEYSHQRRLTLRLQMFGKTAVLQLAYLLEASPYLEDLHLDMYCYKACRLYPVGGDLVGGGSVIADRPHYHLKTACMTGFRGNGGQTELAKYIMRNAVELELMTVDPRDVMFGRSAINEWYGRQCAEMYLAQLEEARGVLTIL